MQANLELSRAGISGTFWVKVSCPSSSDSASFSPHEQTSTRSDLRFVRTCSGASETEIAEALRSWPGASSPAAMCTLDYPSPTKPTRTALFAMDFSTDSQDTPVDG